MWRTVMVDVRWWSVARTQKEKDVRKRDLRSGPGHV